MRPSTVPSSRPFVEPITYDDFMARRWRGLYRLADPKIALASVMPLAAGAALAAYAGGRVSASLLLLAFAAVFCVEVGKNAVNDYFDFQSGADTGVLPEERSPFSGGKRVLVDSLLTEGELIAVAFMGFALALLFGVMVGLRAGYLFLALGALAAAVAHQYTAPPLRLSYRGLGEIAVFLAYGPGIVLGTQLLFAGRITTDAVLASLALGALVANVLVMNEVPDERPDREAGKRTLVVRLGRRRTVLLAAGLFAAAFWIPALGVGWGGSPRLLAALAGLPAALWALADLAKKAGGVVRLRSQIGALAAYVLTGLALTIAFAA